MFWSLKEKVHVVAVVGVALFRVQSNTMVYHVDSGRLK